MLVWLDGRDSTAAGRRTRTSPGSSSSSSRSATAGPGATTPRASPATTRPTSPRRPGRSPVGGVDLADRHWRPRRPPPRRRHQDGARSRTGPLGLADVVVVATATPRAPPHVAPGCGAAWPGRPRPTTRWSSSWPRPSPTTARHRRPGAPHPAAPRVPWRRLPAAARAQDPGRAPRRAVPDARASSSTSASLAGARWNRARCPSSRPTSTGGRPTRPGSRPRPPEPCCRWPTALAGAVDPPLADAGPAERPAHQAARLLGIEAVVRRPTASSAVRRPDLRDGAHRWPLVSPSTCSPEQHRGTGRPPW